MAEKLEELEASIMENLEKKVRLWDQYLKVVKMAEYEGQLDILEKIRMIADNEERHIYMLNEIVVELREKRQIHILTTQKCICILNISWCISILTREKCLFYNSWIK